MLYQLSYSRMKPYVRSFSVNVNGSYDLLPRPQYILCSVRMRQLRSFAGRFFSGPSSAKINADCLHRLYIQE
jgi:hypothetical protein